MNFLHYEVDAGVHDIVEVTLDNAANVQLLDATNYQNYRNGQVYRYFGGYVKNSPYRIRPPHQGHWHIVIDTGGYAGTVRASVQVLQGVA